MNMTQRRQTWLRHAALLCAALVLAITSLSAFIRLSQAGLGCSEWPQCYASRLRDAQQGRVASAADSAAVVAARLTHRVVAVTALLLVIAMVVLCFGNRPYLLREGMLALALLGLALGLAVLGRWTAGTRVPAVAIGNLLGGLLMLALSWRLAARAAPPGDASLRAWARLGAAVLLIQVTLGALLSASYAGLSCVGAMDCLRTVQAAQWPWHALNPWREPVFDAMQRAPNPAGALVQLVHRGGALLTLLVLAPLGVAALRGAHQREGVALLALLVIQIGVGVLMPIASLPLGLALTHNIVAAMLLATLVRLECAPMQPENS